MKALVLPIITLIALANAQAHCGSCGVGDEKDHADHAACFEQTLNSYFSVQKALASDDLAAAKSAATALEEHAADSACSAEGKDCCASVKGATDAIAQASDLKSARAAFKDLSDTVIAQIETSGSHDTVYQMFCPMAFNNKGGSWLQDNADLKNPYYGSMMLTCGVTKATYGESAQMEEGKGHQHHM